RMKSYQQAEPDFARNSRDSKTSRAPTSFWPASDSTEYAAFLNAKICPRILRIDLVPVPKPFREVVLETGIVIERQNGDILSQTWDILDEELFDKFIVIAGLYTLSRRQGQN